MDSPDKGTSAGSDGSDGETRDQAGGPAASTTEKTDDGSTSSQVVAAEPSGDKDGESAEVEAAPVLVSVRPEGGYDLVTGDALHAQGEATSPNSSNFSPQMPRSKATRVQSARYTRYC